MFSSRLEISMGDITKIKIDAIVNSAKTTLLGEMGLDKAIHTTAGSQLLEECKTLDGCNVGEAKITLGYDLSSKYVIHAVSPKWSGGNNDEDRLLASCYEASLSISTECNIKSLAFPTIGVGNNGFPIDRAAYIAISQIKKHLSKYDTPETVFIICNNRNVYNIFFEIFVNIYND